MHSPARKRFGQLRLFIAVVFLTAYVPQCALAQIFSQPTESEQDIIDAGDTFQWLLPVLAWGSTAVARDGQGAVQYTKSFATTVLTTTLIKQAAQKFRPGGTSEKSFPSGHASAAFSGAAFINTRYGWKWGIPAFAGAVVTGYSRVNADQHFLDDVTAGASVALFSNWAFVTSRADGPRPAPMAMGNGYGLAVSIPTTGRTGGGNTERTADLRPHMRYQLLFGPAFLQKNEITAPAATGTTFDLNDFDKINDPTTTASAIFQWFLNERNELTFSLMPFESRDIGQFSSPVSFEGQIYPANNDTISAWRYYELRAQYAREFLPHNRRWSVKLGGALAGAQTTAELQTADGTIQSKVQDFVVLPLLYTSVGYWVPKSKWRAELDVSGMSLSEDKELDAGIMFHYQFSPNWDAGAGLRTFVREIDTSKLKNKIQYDWFGFSVGYTFFKKS